ncbi:MAG TPA: DUF1963 domain-containing protein [Bryobacteraceae bacterium]|nr:DUF1963 domain-containing protein [Bryobacteraceae bacterium]
MSYLEEFARLNARPASALQIGGFRPTNNISTSNFGRKPLALAGEKWPTWKGSPLLFVCQLNLTKAPVVPELLQDIKLMTFFVSPQGGPLQRENGKDWRLRAYKSLLNLVPLAPPDGAGRLDRGCECQWEECVDYPTADDPEMRVPQGYEPAELELENLRRTKIGGYPSHIQSELWWDLRAHPANPQFCCQIDSEEKVGLQWGDRGMVYLGRGTAPGCSDRWFLDWQCY